MSFELIMPFFPEELRPLFLDPSISDLMINGTTGVFAEKNGEIEYVPLECPYSNERLQAAIERQRLDDMRGVAARHIVHQRAQLAGMIDDGAHVRPRLVLPDDCWKPSRVLQAALLM